MPLTADDLKSELSNWKLEFRPSAWSSWPAAVFIGALAWMLFPNLRAAEPGKEVAVVFNKNMPESEQLAQYYAEKRHVPTNQIFGFDLPLTEEMSRADFRQKLQHPLLEALKNNRLLVFPDKKQTPTEEHPELPSEASIRYLALCFGVPLRIAHDPGLSEPGIDQLRPELRRNEAAVDNELALLPHINPAPRLYGSIQNKFYATTNAALFHPTNGILLVARLDGPSAAIARGLIDKAMNAETNGLWGRAYFDARGLTNSSYVLGDQFILRAAEFARRLGFETVVDKKPETFPASFPMSHIAFYAGWYEGQFSGPFLLPQVEFMPGAFAYHLHSFSALSIRTPNQYWVGPLLDKGATATMGSVAEPYLEGTPDIATFFSRLVYFDFSFAEAAYSSQIVLSWQTTVVGDPIYRPFHRPGVELHNELSQRKSPLLEWSLLRAVNMKLAQGISPQLAIDFLLTLSQTPSSAVLTEKLANLRLENIEFSKAIESYQAALELKPSPQQRIRLCLALGQLLSNLDRDAEAYAVYDKFRQEFPQYPDLAAIYKKLLPLARSLGKTNEVEELQKEIARLTAPKTQ